jgi:hypothetical protein
MKKAILLNNGLKGLYNPLFAKFVCINCCDMKSENQDINVKGVITLADIAARIGAGLNAAQR